MNGPFLLRTAFARQTTFDNDQLRAIGNKREAAPMRLMDQFRAAPPALPRRA
jgi:hypothetical protein